MPSLEHDSDEMQKDYDVVIVGAGPVGLLTALKLGLAGIDTLLLEKQEDILSAARAIAYMPTVNREFAALGIYDEIKAQSYVGYTGPSWRTPDGKALAVIGPAEMPIPSDDDGFDAVLMLGQDKLARLILKALKAKCPSVQVKFRCSCLAVQQDFDNAEIVSVKVSESGSEYSIKARWLVGADGANSAVRSLSDIPFEGFTWENFRFTAADVRYKFDEEGGYRPGNFIVDPQDWAVIARTGPDDVWRIAYGEAPHLPDDQASMIERSKQRIPVFLPGSKDYELVRLRPYWAQQRCAPSFRKGRVLLAGDAAHSNNPVGDLGLTGGILDAVVLGNCLVRCIRDGENGELITKALYERREIWTNMVNPMSQGNYLRLCSEEPAAVQEREGFFDRLNNDMAFQLMIKESFGALLPNNYAVPASA